MSLVASIIECAVVPYNDPSVINKQRYQFTSEDRLVRDIKAIPEWPYYARLFDTLSHGRCEFMISSARDGFSPQGDLGNSAVVWFKKNPLKFRDVCAFARLVEANQTIYTVDRTSDLSVETETVAYNSTSNNFLRFLAGQDLAFDANTQKQGLMLKYARACWDEAFYLGFELGIVRAAQTLKMVSRLTASEAADFADKYDNAKSTDATKLLKEYPNGLGSVFDELMREKGFGIDQNDEATLAGDTRFFVNVPLRIEGIRAASFSMYVTIPSPQQNNTTKLIQPFVGEPHSGVSLGCSAGFLFKSSPILNLHVFSSAQYTIPRLMSRRVPRSLTRIVSNDPLPIVTGTEVDPSIPLSSGAIHYRGYAAFSTPDSYIPDFADGIRSINVRRGPEIGVQIGNVVEDILFKNLQLDVSYKFKFKANDVLGISNNDDGYNRDLVVSNSFFMGHTISGTLNYEYNDSLGFTAGCNYTFAGRRVLKELSGFVGISGVF